MFGLGKFISGGDPRAYRQEIGSAGNGYLKSNDGLASGLVAGTLVATELGWRPIEAIAQGDMVLTFDNGMQPVRSVLRGTHWRADSECPQSLWPLNVPAGAIGNLDDMKMMPEQTVMVESDAAAEMLDDPFVLLAVAELEGYRGIERVCPRDEIQVISLQFDEDEIVFAAAGALVFCPTLANVDMVELMSDAATLPSYRVLKRGEANVLVDCLMADEAARSGFCAHASVACAA